MDEERSDRAYIYGYEFEKNIDEIMCYNSCCENVSKPLFISE